MDKVEQIKKWIKALLIVSVMASVFSVFFIQYWIVLIINFGCIIGLIIFEKVTCTYEMSKKFAILFFIVMLLILLGFMIAVMVYPTKICGGVFTNPKSADRWFFDRLPDEAARIKRYRVAMGIFFIILLVYNLVILGVIIARRTVCLKGLDGFVDDEVPFILLSVPLYSIGGILVTCIPWGAYIFMIICGGFYALIPILFGTLAVSSGSYGGGGSDSGSASYTIIITRND